jgi:integrase
MKVTIRSKSISKGLKSLYLDIYPPISNPATGKLTRREFLGLYTFDKPKGKLEKEHNKGTLALAENIKAKRQLDIQSEQYGFLYKAKLSITLLNYYKEQVRKKSGSNSSNWKSSLFYMKQFFNENTKLSELTVPLCEGYREYLMQAKSQRNKKVKLSRNSTATYFNKFKATLKQAYKEDLISTDLNSRIDFIPTAETRREYLTLEELKLVNTTNCKLPVLKQAAMFSALSGLRFSDIAKLKWSEIQSSVSNGNYIQFRQQKTNGEEVLPISDEALKLLGDRCNPSDLVFPNLKYSAYNNTILKNWLKEAGIMKKITFHNFRHTHATLQLSLGTDIYTVSKLLGHRDLKTTQLYAKVIDKQKQDAVSRIKLGI